MRYLLTLGLICLFIGNSQASNLNTENGNASGIQKITSRSSVQPQTTATRELVKATPLEMNYQGWLGDATDTAGVTGNIGMIFRLYNTSTAGTELWSETQISVLVVKGIFNVLLGSVTPIPANIFTGTPLWLETQVAGDTLSPRKKIVSVGYAMRAVYADTAAYATATADAIWEDIASYIRPKDANNFTIYDNSSSYTGLSYVGATETNAITNWSNDGTQTYLNYHANSGDRYAGYFKTTGDSIGNEYGIYAESNAGYAGYFNGDVNITGDLTAANLPGLVSDHSNREIILATADSVASTLVLTAPSAGFVMVTLTGLVDFHHTNGTKDYARTSISKTAALDYTYMANIAKDAGDATTSDATIPFAITRVEAVTAGDQTYYFVCDKFAGSTEVIRYQFTAVFYPTSYGTVSKAFTSSPSNDIKGSSTNSK